MEIGILIFASFATSTFAAVVGLGGGMLLLGIMPFFVGPAALIPIHGTSQLASNFSRACFAFSNIAWRFCAPFIVGSIFGLLITWQVLRNIDGRWIPLMIGSYMLAHLWLPRFKRLITRYENFYMIGAIQSGLGPLVGATGPLTTTLLMTHCKNNKESIVATNALLMSFSHAVKLIIFALLGFAYSDYLFEIAGLTFGAILGSYFGSYLRQFIPGEKFITLLKALLTLLALKLIVTTLV